MVSRERKELQAGTVRYGAKKSSFYLDHCCRRGLWWKKGL